MSENNDENRTILYSVGPIGKDFIGKIDSIFETKRGDIYESEALIDYKNEKIIKINIKRIRFGPLLKRLPSKIFVITCTLIIGLVVDFYFSYGKIIYWILGAIIVQIFEETLVMIQNKKFDKLNKTEIVKRK